MDNYDSQLSKLRKIITILLLVTAYFIALTYQKPNVFTIYVEAGAEKGDGSQERPFASIEEARQAIRQIGSRRFQYTGIVVEVADGEYLHDGVVFDKKDSGTKDCPITYRAINPGKVILNNGIKLDPALFEPLGEQRLAERFREEVKSEIVCISLADLGITDFGKIGAIGSFHTAAEYEGDWIQDPYCELFYNDQRKPMARYPDEGFVYTESVVEEDPDLNTEIYTISKDLSNRVASWQSLDEVWMFGYWAYDWADASSPIGLFDAENRNLAPKFHAFYHVQKDNVPFFFFNVPEELDVPGEWYLDRQDGVLYLYPEEDFEQADITFSISTDPLIRADDVSYLNFDGFVFEGSRSDGLVLNGEHLTLSNSLIRNVGCNAVVLNGSNNLIYNNEFTGTGKGGVIMNGGDREKLIPGKNIVDNNLFHDFSQVYYTYCPAVTVRGVGNVCTHNEIFNSPHEAIHFGGNDHLIAYNDIHDVCLLSDDAGAIYAGRSWHYYGNKINYNYIHDIGRGDNNPNGIYLDDNLSGITVIGNVVVRAKGYGILLGGGRDLDVENNLLVSCRRAFMYDDRAIKGAIDPEYWYAENMPYVWNELYASPWQSEIWKKAYPQMARFSTDASDLKNPDFVPNPAYSTVINNVEYRCEKSSKISDAVKRFSMIAEYTDVIKAFGGNEEEIFADPANGDYSIREDVEVIEFADENLQPIPFGKIGRQ